MIFIQASFPSLFDADVPVAAAHLLGAFGYRVRPAPLHSNGKALHVLGFRTRCEATAERAANLAAAGLPLVSVEAVSALMHQQEYLEGREGAGTLFPTLDAFLAAEFECDRLRLRVPPERPREAFRILLHCTEKTATPRVTESWRIVFEALGLTAEFPSVGCCGIAGLFGHQREHREVSRCLFDLSWREGIEGFKPARILATGFSRRCQVERFTGFRPRHPAQALLQHLERAGPLPC